MELRSFLSMANFLALFTSSLAEATMPLRDLLQHDHPFGWLEAHKDPFSQTKEALLTAPVMAPFDPTAPTTLHTDASRLKGLEYALRNHSMDKSGSSNAALAICPTRKADTL